LRSTPFAPNNTDCPVQGASIPPVEEQVVGLKLATPSGDLLSIDKSSPLFALAKCGLGALGVVYELTIQCVPLHWLEERTEVMTRSQVQQGHRERLRNHRHVRYMWIPYEDVVVVVTSNECRPAECLPDDSRPEGSRPEECRPEECRPEAQEDEAEDSDTLTAGHESLIALISETHKNDGSVNVPSVKAMRKMSFAGKLDFFLAYFVLLY
jgi:hypothetical protein